MSYDIDILTEDVDGNKFTVEVVSGHTWNLAPMWRKALPSIKSSVYELDGRKCLDVMGQIISGHGDALEKPDEYKALNPPNGWGDYKGFLEVYTRFMELCIKHPSGTIRIS